jgi:hypothetical protein
MATIDSAVCIEELLRQCEVALEAIGQLNYALMNLYQVPSGGSRYDTFKGEVFEIIYTFLGSAACIARILWPDAEGRNRLCRGRLPFPKGRQTNGPVTQGAAQRTLGATRKRFLKILKRTCPSSRIAIGDKAWEQLRDPHTCHIIGSPIAVTGYPSPMEVQIYDPTTRDFYMDGEVYPLQEIAAAIALLQECALGKENKPARILTASSPCHFDDSWPVINESAQL